MAINQFFAGVATADYGSALGWYERLLGRPLDFFPNDNEAVCEGMGIQKRRYSRRK